MTDQTGAGRAGTHNYSAKDLLTNPAVLIDSVAPMILFVTVNGVAGLLPAAVISVVFTVAVVVVRAVRGQRLVYGLFAIAGIATGVGTALWSASAGGFFGPGMVLNAAYAVGALVSIPVGWPFVAVSSWMVYRWPWAWYRHPRVLPAYREITVPWALLFVVRAFIRFRIIQGGEVGVSDTALVLLTGWPAFAVLLIGTYAYVNWRLERLQAPEVDAFRPPRRDPR